MKVKLTLDGEAYILTMLPDTESDSVITKSIGKLHYKAGEQEWHVQTHHETSAYALSGLPAGAAEITFYPRERA